MRILLVEDDRELAGSLKSLLEEEGFRVRLALDGKRGLDLALTEDIDLILLDYLLPSMSGEEFLKKLREEGSKTPVLVVTVMSDVRDKVKLLSLGADDYITKPFNFQELLARIRAVLRRYRGLESSMVEIEGVVVNLSSREVFVEGKEVKLTAGEYALLEYLFMNRGRFVSREELLERALHSYDSLGNTVEVLVHRLRKKLGRDIIKSRRGFGYRVG
ncbi:two-component system OmpR family response regulator [Hydrogenivirga caldilitoris]|uniref:Two-component system OmpR family response regulator n=1 Tax=Hydrogenivirga caldilitoris TaxID=246264 RepID=A0A497XRU0_9AQUI|nr:response regulator transcription factor [Hydrogenivirga caldilitoris]RLJ69852.1 two-component system OmpR family response regulator [Hydrogenivirga caldilitoris]